ncbi:hypothetical protein HPB51_001784 [Rhipicephalus microplus]|uniref:Uncharacterized protein n=1 Tax=Rhipicephalus microplus TaxID=6941 RepID=A0A9J6EWV9_RHIMP|nr:hypothetical protein HPB51_001784 [Rhipicephalus microplus]
MLSLYSLVKPPKFGNCTLPDKRQAAVVTLSDIREIYKGSAAQRTGKLDELKRKLDGLIDEGSWECDDVFDFDDPDTDATVVECIVYYVYRFCVQKTRNGTTCSICKTRSSRKQGLASVPEADLVNCKTRGWLTHPNMHLFDFFKYTEEQFAKYAGDRDAYDKTTDAVLENFHFTFPAKLLLSEEEKLLGEEREDLSPHSPQYRPQSTPAAIDSYGLTSVSPKAEQPRNY